MKISIEQLIEKKGSLDKVLQKDMPFKLSYRLSKLAAKVMQEIKHIDKTRNEMIKKYGEKTDQGHRVPKDKLEEFRAEWADLVQEEIDFTVEKIPMETLETINLSAFDIANLECFIEQEPEGKEPEKKEKDDVSGPDAK